MGEEAMGKEITNLDIGRRGLLNKMGLTADQFLKMDKSEWLPLLESVQRQQRAHDWAVRRSMRIAKRYK